MKASFTFASVVLAAASAVKAQLPIYGDPQQQQQQRKLTIHDAAFRADSKAASDLVASSTRLLDGEYYEEYYEVDTTFVAQYSVKFQGCHHISQWNSDSNGDDTVRIRSKRLVRFRLCPHSSCDSSSNSVGCKSKFGDYVVDLNTFVYYYLQADAEEKALRGQYDNSDFDASDYAQCAEYDGFQYDGAQQYVGPYCAEQGGSIYLGVFSDETCTTFSSCGDSCFYNKMGFELPYASKSLVDTQCHSCSRNYIIDQEDVKFDTTNPGNTRNFCKKIYTMSGKCEARLNSNYGTNDSACTYIEGIKIIRDDGVLRTNAMRKSRPAAVAIGLMVTSSVLLVAYVYYLRTKLTRAKVNLDSATSAVYA